MRLKEQLAIYLKHRDLTAARLARSSGVSKQVLSQWLGGVAPRKLEQVKRVADTLNTSVDHLCFGNGVSSEDRSPFQEFNDEIDCGQFEVVLRRVRKSSEVK